MVLFAKGQAAGPALFSCYGPGIRPRAHEGITTARGRSRYSQKEPCLSAASPSCFQPYSARLWCSRKRPRPTATRDCWRLPGSSNRARSAGQLPFSIGSCGIAPTTPRLISSSGPLCRWFLAATRAVEALLRALELRPNHAPGYTAAGEVLARLGERDAALQVFERAIALAPDLGDAHLNLALLLAGKEEFDGAARHMAKALELGKRFRQASPATLSQRQVVLRAGPTRGGRPRV